MGLRRASDGQLLVEQRVPAVTYAVGFRRFGFVGIVFGGCTIAHAHRKRSMGSHSHIRSLKNRPPLAVVSWPNRCWAGSITITGWRPRRESRLAVFSRREPRRPRLCRTDVSASHIASVAQSGHRVTPSRRCSRMLHRLRITLDEYSRSTGSGASNPSGALDM
jgi:hypothetical protein